MMAGKVMDNSAARKGNRRRISRIKTMDITIRVNHMAGDGAPGGRALRLLHNQNQKQLSAADLRAFDDQGAAFAQLGVGLKQELFLLVKFQVQNVARLGFASRINMQPEKFAGCEPVFLASLECLLRLANHLELVVAEKFFKRPFDAGQFRWNRLWLGDLLRDAQYAPDRLRYP